ncbi:hypothetical protein ANTRET_LOCUS10633 [Anthophora retusa]
MALKLKNSLDYLQMKSKKGPEKVQGKRKFSKVEAVYAALICFATHCLSCIVLEAGGRSLLGNATTKSAVFNTLFRRNYNLKIIILVANVITGLITTLMMTVADKYDVPYLYLPWLANTIKGMTLCEGPALFNLANVLLSNITLPTASFLLVAFFLYVEEFFIWSDAFARFLHCWKDYHDRNRADREKTTEKQFAVRKKKLSCQDDAENSVNIDREKLKCEQTPIEFCEKASNRTIANIRLRPTKSTTENNSNFIRNQLLNTTG